MSLCHFSLQIYWLQRQCPTKDSVAFYIKLPTGLHADLEILLHSSHVVPEPRKQYKLLGSRTKSWIKGLRTANLGLRVLQGLAAAGILFLFIIINNVASLTAWIMRITAGVVLLHCAYGVFHLARPAGARPPASSAGYQTFASVTDLAVLPLYAYGCLSIRNSSGSWGTLLQDKSLMNYFLPALFYTLFTCVVLHLITMVFGLWLALKFRQIARLPPDMNPLEDNLTSRQQKKLSVATTATYRSEDGRVPLEELRRSGMPYEETERPPSVPFHATRSSPRSSFGSAEFPSRQYQIEPGNSPRGSPRNSFIAAGQTQMSTPPQSSHSSIVPTPPPRSPWRNSQSSYAEISTSDIAEFRPPYGKVPNPTPPSPRGYGQQSRPSTANTARQQPAADNTATNPAQPRPAKFTEAWYATESLFNRTHAKNKNSDTMPTRPTQGYEAIQRRYDLSDSDSESDYENETATAYSVLSPPATEIDMNDGDLGSARHPEPLRSNPSLPSIAGTSSSAGTPKPRQRPLSSFVSKSALSEIDLNDGRVSGTQNSVQPSLNSGGGADIADEKAAPSYGALKSLRASSKRHTWAPRDRQSSIQPEAEFYSKPYGDLRPNTPPVIIGTDRQVSSGNDYDLSGMGGGQAAKRYFSFGRRNVSGKVVEEGRAIGYAH